MKDEVIKIKIDRKKVSRGHTPHRSGAGKHKNWRKKNRTHEKADLRREN